MGEETTPVEPQAGTPGEPQPQAGEITTSTEPQAGEGQNDTLSREEAKKLRSEAANLRKRLKAFEDEAKTREEAQLTKEQLLEKQLAELNERREQELQERFVNKVQQQSAIEAAKLGVDPAYLDKVFRFLEWEALDADDDGNPTNVSELIAQLVKEMPGLKAKGAPVSSGGATNPPRSQSTAPVQLSWDAIGKMKPDEYAARREEIQDWIAKNPHRYGSRMK